MAANGNLVAPPTSLAEAEQLVKRLYAPGNPRVVAAVDDQLKRLQLSPEGWQLADGLLGSQDRDVRYYALLTFQVKLNVEGYGLDAATTQSVLMRMLHWTAALVQAGEGDLVSRKLSGTLATYFFRTAHLWEQSLLHLAFSLQRGEAVPGDQLPASPDAISHILPSLTESQLNILLWFSGMLATEAAKIGSSSAARIHHHDQLEILVTDATKIMQCALRHNDSSSRSAGKLKAESLGCFLNWVNYAQPMWAHKQQALDHLRELVDNLSALLVDPVLQNEAMDVFRDILESYTSFFQPRHMELLATIIQQHTRPRLLQALRDQEPEVVPVAQLVIAFGIANIVQVVEQPEYELGSRSIVQLLFAILESPGHPGDDDEVSIHSIEFWNTYIEYVNEAMYSRGTNEVPPPWLEQDKAVCMRLSTLLWSKMKTPPPSVLGDWSDAESDGFKEFRMDASDLILSIFVRLGNELLQHFIQLALDSLSSKNWQDLEAAMFCINTLADNVLEDPSTERLLVHIFGSPLFREIADFSQPIPKQTRRTGIDMLGTYGAYIERHAEFLPDTLRFLFASLETEGFHLSAAKSIDTLCSTCRTSLTGELDGFIAQYHRFAQSPLSEPYTNERIIGAIAAIVQAVTPESAKAQPLRALLDIVDGIVVDAKQLAARSTSETTETFLVSAVDCLVRIGKGMQAPEDVPINLYDDDRTAQDGNNFWRSPEGQAIQARIMTTCHSVVQMLPTSGDAIEAICNVMRAGFTETEPGPFVFPPDVNIAFLEQCSVNTPRVEYVLSMICTLIVQHSRKEAGRIDSEITRIYVKTVSFLQTLGSPSQDPGVAQICIDVFNKMIGRYANVLLDTASTGELVQPILDFAVKAIDGPDLFPKRAAADFWAKMLRPFDSAHELVQTRQEQVINAYGSPLCQALVNQITGSGQRSELDQLCEPLRVLVQSRPQTKAWLESALLGESAPTTTNSSVGEQDKRRFVQQVIGLRGDGRKTKDMVKNFYAACRGTIPSY